MPTPAQLLDTAEQEFQQHSLTAGANLVRDAVYQTVVEAGRNANLSCRSEQDAYDIAEKLDQKQPAEPVDFWLSLRVADAFRTQAAHHGEDGDWQWGPGRIHRKLGRPQGDDSLAAPERHSRQR